jgi:hypothetical protein
MAPISSGKQFIEDIRSEEALAALTDKWHLGESLQQLERGVLYIIGVIPPCSVGKSYHCNSLP